MLRELEWHRTATTQCKRRTRYQHRTCRTRLNCESLEDRRLLAIDVQFDAATGSLTLSDLDDLNVVNLGVDHSGVQPQLIVNDWHSGIATYDVRAIHVFAGNGDDVIDLSVVDFFSFPNIEHGQVSIYGGMGNDAITGSGWGDVIYAGAGNDTLYGGKGDDQLRGQSGIDSIHGQEGDDTLAAGKIGLLPPLSIGGLAAGTTLGRPAQSPAVPVELIAGGPGNDWFEIVSPDTTSTLDIADDAGVDTVDFSALQHGAGLAGLDLSQPQFELVAGAHRRTTLNFPAAGTLENVVGTRYADVIRGNDQDNRIDGGDGDDRLEGRGGLDVLLGSAGHDTLIGDEGNDILDGGVGNDVYLFETASLGFDTITDEDGSADRLDVSGLGEAVRVNLSSPVLVASRQGDPFRVMLAAGQMEEVIGTDFDDILSGNDADNLLEGRGGNDLILGGGGNDTLFGGAGVDALDPGAGQDYVDPGIEFDDPEVQDVTVQVTGDFTLVNHVDAFNGAAYVASPVTVFPASAADKVVWSFDGLSDGAYELFATWVPDPTAAATNANFVVNGLLDRTVNQQLAPQGTAALGFTWASLGQLAYVGPEPLEVELRAA